MSSTYWFYFTPNPADSANLTPVFLNFVRADGTTLTPPAITQIAAGTGIYRFAQSTSVGIFFRIDGATTGGGLSPATRYIAGAIDPIDQLDGVIGTTLAAIGATLVATGVTINAIGVTQTAQGVNITGIGNTLLGLGSTIGDFSTTLGSTTSSFGTTSVDPGTVFGYLKRIRELLEGGQSFSKTSAEWLMYSRGFTTLLAAKTVTNDATGVTRS